MAAGKVYEYVFTAGTTSIDLVYSLAWSKETYPLGHVHGVFNPRLEFYSNN